MNYGDPGAGSSTTEPAPQPSPQPSQPAGPSYSDINNLYTKYLGRSAGQDEYSNWLSGAFGHTDLPGIEQQIQTSGEGQGYMGQHLTPNPLATFTGFDPSRLDSNTLKYNAQQVLGSFNPNDPNAMAQAYQILNTRYPGQYELDNQGNLMLTGTADGYIGARPIGWGSGGAWYEPSQGQYDWQWMAYNAAHPGPSGEGTGIGGAGGAAGRPGFGGLGTGGGQGGASLLSSLQQMLGLGQAYGGPGSAGIFNPSAGGGSNLVQQIGQDPFSQTITGALTQLMGTAGQNLTNASGGAQTPIDDALRAYLAWAQGKATTDPTPNDADAALKALLAAGQGHLTSSPQDQAAAFEKARMPYEMARKVQLGNARGELANRGLLSDATPGGGLEGGAVDRIESNLAPAYTGALAQAWQEMNQNEQNWAGLLNNAVGTDTSRQTQLGNLQQGYGNLWGNAIATGNTRENQQSQEARDWANILGNAANAGTNRQQVLGSLAIQELQQNNEFTKFLANYGLDRDKALADIAHGQNLELLQAFQLYLQFGQLANAGYV
jgi:hypothetical protein